MVIKDIITIVISSLAFIVSFISLYKSLVGDKINYIKKECIKLNTEVLEKIYDIAIIDIYKAAKNIGDRNRKENIDKLFHQLDFYCSNISIARQEMHLFYNKKRIDRIVDYFSGSYIRQDAERIITYTYSKNDNYDFGGPFSIYKSFDVLFKIIDHKIGSYVPTEKYKKALEKSIYINWKDEEISKEYNNTIKNLVDIIQDKFIPYDECKDYDEVLENFNNETGHLFDFLKGVKLLYNNESSKTNLSFRSKDINNKENKYLRDANESINNKNNERKYELLIDDSELKKIWNDLDNKNNPKYNYIRDSKFFDELREKLYKCAITNWS